MLCTACRRLSKTIFWEQRLDQTNAGGYKGRLKSVLVDESLKIKILKSHMAHWTRMDWPTLTDFPRRLELLFRTALRVPPIAAHPSKVYWHSGFSKLSLSQVLLQGVFSWNGRRLSDITTMTELEASLMALNCGLQQTQRTEVKQKKPPSDQARLSNLLDWMLSLCRQQPIPETESELKWYWHDMTWPTFPSAMLSNSSDSVHWRCHHLYLPIFMSFPSFVNQLLTSLSPLLLLPS